MDAYRQEVNDNIWAGVVFTGDFSNGWPKDITYKLRVTKDAKNRAADWLTDYTFNYFQTFGFRNNDTRGDKPGKKTIISRSWNQTTIMSVDWLYTMRMLFRANSSPISGL